MEERKYYCDGCGNEVKPVRGNTEPEIEIQDFLVNLERELDLPLKVRGVKRHVCPECYKKLKELLKL